MKENQKTLEEICYRITTQSKAIDTFSEKDLEHGRIDRRETEVFLFSLKEKEALASLGWKHLECIACVTRLRKKYCTKERHYKNSLERALYVSTIHLSAETLHEGIRKHWGIENRNHYVRDTSLQEDASRIRKNPQIFATLRSFALNIMRNNGVQNIKNERYKNTLSYKNLIQYNNLF